MHNLDNIIKEIMYKKAKYRQTSLQRNDTVEGETMEQKIQRFKNNNEPITDAATPKLYTERADGVIPAYDIRTDKMELAVEAADKAHKIDLAKRTKGIEERKKALEDLKTKDKNDQGDGKPESTQGTSGSTE